MGGGSSFNATQVESIDDETSERNPYCEGFNVRASRDPDRYTRATSDPKHHGQAMSSSLRVQWIKSQALAMQGLWKYGVFKRYCTHLTPQNRIFSSRFHCKIKSNPLEHYLAVKSFAIWSQARHNSLRSIKLKRFCTLMDIGIPLHTSCQ